MILFQVIVTILILLSLINLYKRYQAKKLSRTTAIMTFLFAVLVEVVVIFPDITSVLALRLGIGRGSDLAVYASILLLFYLIYRIYLRLNKIERNITKLVRNIAVEEKAEKNKE